MERSYAVGGMWGGGSSSTVGFLPFLENFTFAHSNSGH